MLDVAGDGVRPEIGFEMYFESGVIEDFASVGVNITDRPSLLGFIDSAISLGICSADRVPGIKFLAKLAKVQNHTFNITSCVQASRARECAWCFAV